MTDEKFSPEQSLQLIQTMISKTKQDMSDNGIHFLGLDNFYSLYGPVYTEECFRIRASLLYMVAGHRGDRFQYLAWNKVGEKRKSAYLYRRQHEIPVDRYGTQLFCSEYDPYKDRLAYFCVSLFYFVVWVGNICFREYSSVQAITDRGYPGLGTGHRVSLR